MAMETQISMAMKTTSISAAFPTRGTFLQANALKMQKERLDMVDVAETLRNLGFFGIELCPIWSIRRIQDLNMFFLWISKVSEHPI